MPEETRRLVPVPARLFARLEPDRAGLRKAQSAPAQSRSPNSRSALAHARGDLQPVRATRMLELSQGRRICVRVSVRCSRLSMTWKAVARALIKASRCCSGLPVARAVSTASNRARAGPSGSSGDGISASQSLEDQRRTRPFVDFGASTELPKPGAAYH